jgi:hypothetical protein
VTISVVLRLLSASPNISYASAALEFSSAALSGFLSDEIDREFAVGFFDFLSRSTFIDAQYFVIISF